VAALIYLGEAPVYLVQSPGLRAVKSLFMLARRIQKIKV
jgi:hypothetical protein